MTLKTLLTGLAVMGFVGCAGAQSAATDSVEFTRADVDAAPDDWRTIEPDNLIIMQTSKGEILIELLPVVAEAHVDQFKAYVRAGLYDNTPFHRVIDGFMAQGGDVATTHGSDKMMAPLAAEFTFRRNPAEVPLDTIGPADSADSGLYLGFPMTTQPGFLAEMSVDGLVESWIPHCPGVLSTARTDDVNSGNAQFFLISDEGQHLDYKYTAKGRAVTGLDVIKSIKLGPGRDGFPIANPDVVISAQVAADLSASERPTVFVQRTNTQAWSEVLETADRKRTPICDLPSVAVVVDRGGET